MAYEPNEHVRMRVASKQMLDALRVVLAQEKNLHAITEYAVRAAIDAATVETESTVLQELAVAR